MQLRSINERHLARVAAVLEDMLARTKAGKLPSLIFIAEEDGGAEPVYGIVGRLQADPVRAIGHLAIMKSRVIDLAAEGASGHWFK